MKYGKVVFSFFGTTFIYLMGGFDSAIKYLLIVMAIDYVTGIIKAFVNKKLSSEIGIKGIGKKVYILCLVALSVVVDNVFGQTGVIRNLMIYYIIANEGLSIIENSAEFGFPVPQFLQDALEQIKNNEK